MYDFYYNVLEKIYDKIKLLFTDTNNLYLEIETNDVYKDMKEPKEYYDFNEYPKDHFLYGAENQAVFGKFKDAMEGKIVTEFLGLRSKLCPLIIQDEVKQKKVANGVKKCSIDKKSIFDDHGYVLKTKQRKKKIWILLNLKKHNVNTTKVSKTCLSCFNNK